MIEEEEDQLTYERLRFNQLEIAHKSTLLVYSKNREVVRKLRPEFLRCFIVNEIKDCTRLIKKYCGVIGEPGIDIVILDGDGTGIKILDSINKRPFFEATSKLPIIYSVMLLPPNADNTLKENIEAIGGPNQLLTLPCSTKNILYAVLDVLWRGQVVEKNFNILTQSVQRAKFAYIPIFKSDNDDEESVRLSNDENEEILADDSSDPLDNYGKETSDQKTDVVDDWTYSSSIEANWMKSMRQHENEKHNEDTSLVEKADKIHRRHNIDKNIASDLNKGRSTSSVASNGSVEVVPVHRKTAASLARNKSFGESSVLKLLDASNRPHFLLDSSSEAIEVKPFFDRQLPDIKKMHTVGGLDKTKAQNMWNIVTSGKKKSEYKTHSQVDIETDSIAPENHPFEDIKKVEEHNKQTHDQDAMVALNKKIKEVEKAQKSLKHMAKHAPEDFLVHEIIPISLQERKFNLTEKEFYMEALRLETEGEFEKAISIYRKVGVHSKEPQVSKVFIALLLYKQKQYMNSLNFLNMAIEMIQFIDPGLYNKYDEFIAFYNRGVVNFRVGNDDQGLQDLHQATIIFPDHIKAAEVYSVALRRMQKFRSAIDVTIQKQRKLEKLQENQEAQNLINNLIVKSSLKKHKDSTLEVDSKNVNKTTNINFSHHSETNLKLKVDAPDHIQLKILDKFPVTLNQRIFLTEMKSREIEHGSNSKNDVGKSSQSLPLFKVMIGYKSDLFDSIFVKPSELQDALAVPPFHRSFDDISTIATVLKVSPFLRDLSNTMLNELASSVEYRLIAEDTKIFVQDRPIDAMILVLKGRVEITMEGISNTQAKVTIGEARQLEPCGHIDMLFQEEDTSMFSDFLKMINTKQDNENDKSKLKHRCFQSNIFASYEIEAMSEILLISRNVFDKIIASHMVEEMKNRLDILMASRLFSNWNMYDIIRLARMGQVRSFKSGDIIIEQASSPTYLYLIMKGMCKAYKKPHKGEIFLRHLNILKGKADRHDLKYTYHHKMRHILKKPENVNLKHKHKSTAESNIDIHSPHLTDTEYSRHLLAQEIQKYEILLHKAQLDDAKHYADDSTIATVTPSEENQSEIATLQWPMLFGEVSVLEPESGVSQGTIVADTACDVFMIHKTQIQTFHVDENFLGRIKIRSVKYPNDVDLTGIIDQKKDWKKYRASCLNDIRKQKWPGWHLLNGGTPEPFV